MPRGKYVRKTLTLAPMDIDKLIPADVTTIVGWDKLNKDEQSAVTLETKLLEQAVLTHGTSKLAIGEHLTKVSGVLEPHNLFEKFLRKFNFSKRTAYRYIAGFKNAQTRLPANIVKAAIVRGMNIIGDTDVKPLGSYTSAAAKLPPPPQATEIQANTWLDQVEKVRKDERSSASAGAFVMAEPQDPQTLLKECYRFVALRYKRLPTNHKTRASWVKNLVGMLLADLGVSAQQTFAPQAVPEEFRAQRGRPAVVQAATA